MSVTTVKLPLEQWQYAISSRAKCRKADAVSIDTNVSARGTALAIATISDIDVNDPVNARRLPSALVEKMPKG